MILIKSSGNDKIFMIPGDLDHDTMHDFSDAVEQTLAAREGADFILDLEKTNFIDSSCLGIISRANRELTSRGRKLRLINVRPGVYATLSVTSLDKMLDITRLSK